MTDNVQQLFVQRQIEMPVGVILCRRPGVTRWQRQVWSAAAVVPGAAPADWRELRREGEVVDYHVATVPLSLHRAEAESYRVALTMEPPAVFVILEPPGSDGRPAVHHVTASAYEAQDYADAGDQSVEVVAMPDGLVAWVQAFVTAHFKEEKFKKRKRDKMCVDGKQDGVGDARVRQSADVYRAPGALKPAADPKPGS